MRPALSVVLCTCNRADLLEGAIGAILEQTPGTPPYEVIVVDNASTDRTAAVLEEVSRRADTRLHVIREPRRGLSYARNAGIAAARAPLLAFTDDDVRVANDWVGRMIETFRAHPEVSWAGGPVRLGEPRRGVDPREPAFGLQDHGPSPFFVGAGRPVCLIGANLGVRSEVARLHGGFDPAVQRIGDGIGSTEDHEFQDRLWRRGLVGLYEPGLMVEAVLDPRRLTRRYRARWHVGHGRFVARMQVPEVEACGGRRFCGVPGHLLRTAIRESLAADSTGAWFLAGFASERLATGAGPRAFIPGLTSVVIPCFNQARYLHEAIESALVQDDVEVIVVDDGSTDRVAPAGLPRVRILRQRNQGVAAARNNGLRSARGEFVLFLDADDRLRPRAVARLRRALRIAPQAPFAFGRHASIDAHGRELPCQAPLRSPGTAFESLLASNFICAPGTVLFRRARALEAGGFARGVDPAADYDLYLRLARTGTPVDVDTPVLDYRAHGASISAQPDRMLAATLRVHTRQGRLASHPSERRAWARGQAFWREFYGSQLVERIVARWHAGHVFGFLRDVAVLARWAPAVLLSHARRTLARRVPGRYSTRYNTNRPSSKIGA